MSPEKQALLLDGIQVQSPPQGCWPALRIMWGRDSSRTLTLHTWYTKTTEAATSTLAWIDRPTGGLRPHVCHLKSSLDVLKI
jgi:phage terminase large subunit-like protein